MVNRVASLGGLITLVLAGLMACDVEEQEPRMVELEQVEAVLSAELCDRMFSCRCEQGRSYDTLTTCEQSAATMARELESIPQHHPGMELTYDPACVGTIVDTLAEVGCSPTIPAEDPQTCVSPCHYYHGVRSVGQPCEIHGIGVSDCAQGLRCSGGACVDPCEDELPDQLLPGAGEACRDGACAGDLLCNFETERCIALPQAGEPCLGGFNCAEGLFCEAIDPSDPMSERQCFAPQQLAAPCRGHGQCQSGYCPVGFCEVRPGEGEACTADVCAAGFDCIDQVCRPADAAICWAYLPGV
ncbi:MAG: hypothetical protein AAGF11_10585 [Myxococcota bacterium]